MTRDLGARALDVLDQHGPLSTPDIARRLNADPAGVSTALHRLLLKTPPVLIRTDDPKRPRGRLWGLTDRGRSNRARILGALADGPRTAQQIAEALGWMTEFTEVTLWPMCSAGEVCRRTDEVGGKRVLLYAIPSKTENNMAKQNDLAALNAAGQAINAALPAAPAEPTTAASSTDPARFAMWSTGELMIRTASGDVTLPRSDTRALIEFLLMLNQASAAA